MGTYELLSVLEYILTDRGTEFGDPDVLETGINAVSDTHLDVDKRQRQKQIITKEGETAW